MARQTSFSESRASPWRGVAGAFLGVEALWWAGNMAFSINVFIPSSGGELLNIVPVALMVLTLLAILVLVQAPRAGIWMGLALQVLMLAEGVVFLLTSSIGLFFTVPLAITTTVCLAAAWPRSSTR